MHQLFDSISKQKSYNEVNYSSSYDRGKLIELRSFQAAINNKNLFDELMLAAKCCSLGQITNALYEVGGQYRRNM